MPPPAVCQEPRRIRSFATGSRVAESTAGIPGGLRPPDPPLERVKGRTQPGRVAHAPGRGMTLNPVARIDAGPKSPATRDPSLNNLFSDARTTLQGSSSASCPGAEPSPLLDSATRAQEP